MRKLSVVAIVVAGALALTGCSSTRQVDPAETNSFQIPGTSWYGFCQGRNAFIWIPSKTDSEPDELEAVIYDDFRCITEIKPSASSKPDTDPDGIVDED